MRYEWSILGAALLLGGFAAAVIEVTRIPGLTEPVVLRLGASLALVGAVAAGFVCINRWDPLDEEPPDVDQGMRVPVPGDGLDDLLFRRDRSDLRRRAVEVRRSRVQEVLRTLARNTLVVDANEPPDRAEQLLDEGTWTEDATLAAFLSNRSGEAEADGRFRLRRRAVPVDVLTQRTISEVQRIREQHR